MPAHRLVIAINANGGNARGLTDDVLDGVVSELIGITVPDDGIPSTFTFLENGTFLYGGRTARRVSG
ncbi:hypothetical protein [Paractinoplanes abujensis]|uniref:Uncharacterized protein n=1 Tax=Paractinoplanes abujensis TaxID=882441 RepID=A0A7W7FZH1_9ACTN|nr:hypothetical protein [Actinoplanes abujensis]MBB4690100.1 hypothetical protein [Actinoplanes abujensis]